MGLFLATAKRIPSGILVDAVDKSAPSVALYRWPRIGRLVADASIDAVLIEHRDHLARFGVEYLEAALS
jgi:putative resolvase